MSGPEEATDCCREMGRLLQLYLFMGRIYL